MTDANVLDETQVAWQVDGIAVAGSLTRPVGTGPFPAVIMVAGTSSVTEASPYFVRTSWTLPQYSRPMADWAYKNGIKNVFTLVSDYAPGIDAEGSRFG